MAEYKKRKIKGKEVIDLILNKNLLNNNDVKDVRIPNDEVLDILGEYNLEYLKNINGNEILAILLKKEILNTVGLDDSYIDILNNGDVVEILSGKEKIYLEDETPVYVKKINTKEIKQLLKNKIKSDSTSSVADSLNNKDEITIFSKKNKIINIQNSINTIVFELNIYKIDTNELLETSYFNLIDENKHSVFIYDDRIVLNPGIHLRSLGYTDGYYKIKYNFYKNLLGDDTNKHLFISQISPSRKELIISAITSNVNTNTTNKITKTPEDNIIFSNMINIFNNINYNELSHFVNFGKNIRHLIVNSQYNSGKMYIKLYEPLHETLGIKDVFWLNYEQLPEYTDKVMLFTEESEDLAKLNYLRPAEFDYRTISKNNSITGFVNFDDLTSTDSTTRNNILYSMFSQSLLEGISLNIEYRDFSDFIFYSSAEKRLKNFHYKIRQIETYQNNINNLSELSGSGYTAPWVGNEFTTSSISSSIRNYETHIDDVINKLDGFERYMYFESSSYISGSYGIFPSMCWPKSTTSKPHVLFSYSSSQAINWYKEMITTASLYDRQNYHKLQNYIPIEMQNDELNHRYISLVNQVSQQLDINYNYIKHMSKLNEYENSVTRGIPSDLLAERLMHFGMPINSGYLITNLPEFILSTGSDSTFSISGSDIHH